VPIDGLVKAVNLIPDSGGRAPSTSAGKKVAAPDAERPTGAYALLGFLVMCIAAAALYVTTSNSIKEKEGELARVEAEAVAVEAQAASLQSFADFQTLASSREQTVKALADSRFPWSTTLDDVSRALPGDVFISTLDGATTSSTSGSGLRGAIQAPSIELTGCTDDQASVARLMSRLREVRGVTRVTLAKSEAVDTVSTGVAPTPATASGEEGGVTTEPCPSGAPPAFSMIIFFERAALSAAASPNLALTGVGPTGPTGPAGTTATTPPATTSTTTSTTP
jgi:Tfp pilus assembly protein PilN